MHRSIAWSAAVAIIVAIALGTAGCGDSEDANGGNSGGAADAQSGGNAAGGGADSSGDTEASGGDSKADRTAAVNETLEGVQADFIAEDGASYCDRLTAAGARQVEEFGKAYAHGTECAEIITAVAKLTNGAGVEQKPSKLISVKFDGDRATATIRNGGRPPEPMIFVKDGDSWKIPDPGFSAQFGKPIRSPDADQPAGSEQTEKGQ